ncbi:uncharacterized protein SMIM29 isoform X1 [Enhydra lutris kenyoni]|uniref:Uncharacterized protein SMIM29 isoform X1 n=1 Tax=Enhydra lutris kenyoni TaxID=391180 RepID=A0A2Y9K3S6_ENHLU|nr:uncharacterized protein SMIM29 isoform X1 [Enhydra lutris kenyoni]
MSRRKSEWTGFAITCSPCTATTPQRSCMRLSRSCSRMWGTPRWYTAGRVATSTSGCPCWTSRPDLTPTPLLSRTMALGSAPGACGVLPHLHSPSSPCWELGLLSSIQAAPRFPCPDLQSLVG